jgi:hypothetical protein
LLLLQGLTTYLPCNNSTTVYLASRNHALVPAAAGESSSPTPGVLALSLACDDDRLGDLPQRLALVHRKLLKPLERVWL